jgi:predicted metalloprotease with PDZ domain
LTNFFDRYIHGLEELPLDRALADFGLRLVTNADEGNLPPFIGLTLKEQETVKFVAAASPAERSGINVGDQLVAIEGLRITSEQFLVQLKDYAAGDTVRLTIFHQDMLSEVLVTLEAAKPTQYFVVPLENPTIAQQQQFIGWLGLPIEAVV